MAVENFVEDHLNDTIVFFYSHIFFPILVRHNVRVPRKPGSTKPAPRRIPLRPNEDLHRSVPARSTGSSTHSRVGTRERDPLGITVSSAALRSYEAGCWQAGLYGVMTRGGFTGFGPSRRRISGADRIITRFLAEKYLITFDINMERKGSMG